MLRSYRILIIGLITLSFLGNFVATGIALTIAPRYSGAGCLPGGGCCCADERGGRAACPMEHNISSRGNSTRECGISPAGCHPFAVAGIPTLTKDFFPCTFTDVETPGRSRLLHSGTNRFRESISHDPPFHPPNAYPS